MTEPAAAASATESPSPLPSAVPAAPVEQAFSLTQAQLNGLFQAREAQMGLERRGTFLAALARARATFKAIHRSKLVSIQPREGRAFTYTYAPMDVILAALDPALTAEQFSLSQQLVWDDKGREFVLTELMHPAGEISNRYPVYYGANVTSKDHAGAVTYARRYGLSLLMCVAADDDTEEEQAEGLRQEPAATAAKNPPVKPAPAVQSAAKPIVKPAQGLVLVSAPTDQESIATAEGQIADGMQELIEAAMEGRRVGIEQIWEELKANPYVAQEVWARIKAKHKDAFATIKAVLKPAAEKAK